LISVFKSWIYNIAKVLDKLTLN